MKRIAGGRVARIFLLSVLVLLGWCFSSLGDFYVVPVVKKTWAPVQKTGQKKCYDILTSSEVTCAGTGQDGEYQKGVASPEPRFQANGDGAVTDKLTGLTWTIDANCAGELEWNNALDFCNTLAAGDCGLTDGSVAGSWRLPSIRELYSLVDYGNHYPALPSGHPFTNVQGGEEVEIGYWSSTPSTYMEESIEYTQYALGVYLPIGLVLDSDHWGTSSAPGYVWCVRGGQ